MDTKKWINYAESLLTGAISAAGWEAVQQGIKIVIDKMGNQVQELDFKKLKFTLTGSLDREDEELFEMAANELEPTEPNIMTSVDEKLASLNNPKLSNYIRMVICGARREGLTEAEDERRRIDRIIASAKRIAAYSPEEWEQHVQAMQYDMHTAQTRWAKVLSSYERFKQGAKNRVTELDTAIGNSGIIPELRKIRKNSFKNIKNNLRRLGGR